MSLLVASIVAALYIGAVVGLHRLNVGRMRSVSGGFPAVRWLDWDSLLDGLIPPTSANTIDLAPVARLEGGGPPPQLLASPAPESIEPRRSILFALVAGLDVAEDQFADAGFSGGEVRWLKTLALVKKDPERALERLRNGELRTSAELYLREHLELNFNINPFNLELAVFATKRRLNLGLARFGEHPALFYVRAQASARIGFNRAAIDDLARAVYFSRQSPFYLRAVVETPYIDEVRPALAQQCRQALDASSKVR